VAYLVAALVMVPWWLWVWLTAGHVWLVPDRLAAPAVVGALVLGLATVGLLGWLRRTPHRPLIGETLARASGPGAATVAVGLGIAWSLALVAALFATEGIQDSTLPLRAAARFARNQYSPFLWPLALPLLAWVAALWRLRHRRPADLAVTAGLLAFAPVVIYSGLNFYDARSGLAFVLFSAVLEAAFVVEAVAWLRRRVSDDVGGSVGRRLRSPAVAVGLAGLLIGGLVGGYAVRLVTHLAADLTDVDEAGATARAKFDWRRAPAVAPVTEWLESNVPSGSTVMISWLYGTELYRQTEGRFVMPYVPTVTLDIPSEGALLRPRDTGRRFLDASFDPAAVGADLLWVRKHPRGSYVGLTLTSLLAELRRTGAQYLVLAGEHAVQSTATIAPDLEAHPAFQERHVVRTPADGIEVYIYAVDRDRLTEPGPSPHLWLDGAAFNALLRDIPRARLGWTGGQAVEALGGERIEIAPRDGSGLLAAEQLRTLLP